MRIGLNGNKDKAVKCIQCNWRGIEADAEDGVCPNCTSEIVIDKENNNGIY